MEPQWLEWAKKLAGFAQNGLTYSDNPYDIERYEHIREIAADMMACHSTLSEKELLDMFLREDGYATPKVDVRGIVFRDDKILLIQESSDGKWAPPGGWADVCDSPSHAVTREILEESGFETKAVKLAAVYDRSRHGHQPPCPFHIYKLFFLCEITGGFAQTSNETLAVDFFEENDLPELSLSKILPEQIRHMFEFYRNPEMSVYFD